MSELTQKELKRILHYDHESGIFTWKVRPANRVKVYDIAGSLNDEGYILINVNKKKYRAHRLAFLYMAGKFPEEGLEVDHINHIRDDNKWNNLRIVTHSENQRNCNRQKNNTAGYTGVYWYENNKKWGAQIKIDGKTIHLGLFDNLDDAITARKDAEVKYNFHKNHGKKN